ncbi:hypothetical protein QUF74_04995 [Candidatus Halobeggiatoa sp. HSG11]|nr:hypothetical protein [Candidatus Halobeggiatoa sp. HSG11]
MLLSRTCIFGLIIIFSSVITYDFTKYVTFGYQTIELAAKTDPRRQNTPIKEGDANASDKEKKKEKKKKKNQQSV